MQWIGLWIIAGALTACGRSPDARESRTVHDATAGDPESAVEERARAIVARKWPGATVRNVETADVGGRTAYGVTVELGDTPDALRYLDVVLTADGHVVFQREKIRDDALPMAVREAWAASGRGQPATIKRLVRHEREDQPEFRFVTGSGEDARTVTFDVVGRVIADVPYRTRGLYEFDAVR